MSRYTRALGRLRSTAKKGRPTVQAWDSPEYIANVYEAYRINKNTRPLSDEEKNMFERDLEEFGRSCQQ